MNLNFKGREWNLCILGILIGMIISSIGEFELEESVIAFMISYLMMHVRKQYRKDVL